MAWDIDRQQDIDDGNDMMDSSDSVSSAETAEPFGDVIPEEEFVSDAPTDDGAETFSDTDIEAEYDSPEDMLTDSGAEDIELSDTFDAVEEDFVPEEEQGPVLRRDPTELWQSGVSAIDDVVEAMRDDLRDKGMEDGPEMEAIVMHERTLQMEELARNINGDFSNPYTPPDFSSGIPDSSEPASAESLADLDSGEISDSALYDATEANDAASQTEDEDIEVLDEDEWSNDMDATPVEDAAEQTVPEMLEEETLDEDSDATDRSPVEDVSKWLGDINPNFDEFDPESPYCNNCGSCAFAVYQRLEGSPDSCASADNIGDNKTMESLTGMEQVSMSPAEIEQRLLSQGNGAHAIIGIDRAEGPGHWFNAACVDGKVVAIDGQTGEIHDWPPDYGNVVNWEMSVKKV